MGVLAVCGPAIGLLAFGTPAAVATAPAASHAAVQVGNENWAGYVDSGNGGRG